MNIIKHLEIFDPAKLEGSVAVIGVGALGSALALQLAKLGIKDLSLYDPDTIVSHNVPNQALYGPADVDLKKATVCASRIYNLTGYQPKCYVLTVDKYNKTILREHAYAFCCVDSMAARQEIFKNCVWLKPNIHLYCDGRMTAISGMAYIFDPRDPVQMKQYNNQEVLYPDSEVNQNLGRCGVTLSVGATAGLIANLMTWLFIDAVSDPRKVGELLISIRPQWSMHFNRFTRSDE